jgi:hypothetical protein
MSAANLMTSIKRTSVNVYEADIFKCSRHIEGDQFKLPPPETPSAPPSLTVAAIIWKRKGREEPRRRAYEPARSWGRDVVALTFNLRVISRRLRKAKYVVVNS